MHILAWLYEECDRLLKSDRSVEKRQKRNPVPSQFSQVKLEHSGTIWKSVSSDSSYTPYCRHRSGECAQKTQSVHVVDQRKRRFCIVRTKLENAKKSGSQIPQQRRGSWKLITQDSGSFLIAGRWSCSRLDKDRSRSQADSCVDIDLDDGG